MNRYFDLYLTAGHSVPVVINANQYDSSETWIFTLYTEDDQLYTPASGSIVGLKSDGHTIANAGTVNNDGQVVIQETVQITAAKGINVFELVLDGNHGTANFVVLVEPRPGDNVTPSDSELTLMEQAIAAAGSIGSVSALTDIVNSVNSRMDEFIADHAGLSSETVLWTGELYKTYASPATTPTGGKATLSQNVTDFDYIGVYTTMNTLGDDQTAEVHWYNADDFAENPTMVTCGTTKAYSSTTDWVAIPYITLLMDSDEVTCTVFNAGLVSWNGQAESNATSQTSEGTTNYQGSVVKIVGIKNTQNDTEVIDARVGADGTVYNTLEARLNAENSALKSAIQQGGMKESIKQALLGLADAVGYKNDSIGATARSALYHALYDAELLRITAVFTQGTNIIYDNDSLDELKQYLTVTAFYDDGTSGVVTSYTLSGTLTVGTSTITVTYSGETTTFNVTVSAGIPSGYTVYDYIQVANRSDYSSSTNNAVLASWIVLKDYDNLDVLSWNLKFETLTGYTRGSALIGARMNNEVTTGDAVYIGSTTSNSIGISSDRSRMIAHGVSTVFSPHAITLDEVNTFVFTNTSESPSEFAFNGDTSELPWTTTLTVTRGLTLFTNPTPTATSMTLQRFHRIGALKLYDLSGNLVGDYLPCVRTSDTRIGMFDRVTQTFFTSSTASYTTVGNSSCYYTVGNWS